MGVANTSAEGEVPASVIWSFYAGGTVLILSVLVTVFKTKEYPPAEFEAYNGITEADKAENLSFFQTLKTMPKTMMQLAIVQLFSWFPLFLMWVYTTPAVAQHYWGTAVNDSSSAAYNEAGNWVGICFAAYSLFAALFSVAMPRLSDKFGRKAVYSGSLLLGGLGYISMYLFQEPNLLLISMLGIGVAWAAILAMPYAILSSVLPAKRMGIYMGLFNLTVVVPQIMSGVLGGPILKAFFANQAIYILILAGVMMILGALSVPFVKDETHSRTEH
jgi:maltose/moltooligosaccharide transporter